MVGDLTPSSAITQEYAKADPVYVEKTIVSTTAARAINPWGALRILSQGHFPGAFFPAPPPPIGPSSSASKLMRRR